MAHIWHIDLQDIRHPSHRKAVRQSAGNEQDLQTAGQREIKIAHILVRDSLTLLLHRDLIESVLLCSRASASEALF